MTLPKPRTGSELEILQRPVEFSFFPVVYRNRGWSLSDTVFAMSPWAVMQGAVNTFAAEEHRAQASAFLRQAQDFYTTAAERLSANPLLFYYAFLNIGKALLRTRDFKHSLDHAHHGLGEQRPSAVALENAELKVPVRDEDPSVFREVMATIGYTPPARGTLLPVRMLLAQVVVGHRQWRDGSGSGERFIGLHGVELVHDRRQRHIWLRLYVDPSDLSRHSIAVGEFADQSDVLAQGFQAVRSPREGLRCYEQRSVATYPTDPADALDELVSRARPLLWRIATSVPGSTYRKYYLCLSPPDERNHRIGQLPALWAALFYFGSMVRYRPHIFDSLSEGPYGAFVSEFISAQPEQLLYLLASEMCRREVAKPAIA